MANPVSVDVAIRNARKYLASRTPEPFFIGVDGSREYQQILSSLPVARVHASDYCRENDAFCDYDQLLNDLASGDVDEPRVLVGLGESLSLQGGDRAPRTRDRILGRLSSMPLRSKLIVLCRGTDISHMLLQARQMNPKFNDTRMAVVDSDLDYTIVGVGQSIQLQCCEGFSTLLQALEVGSSGKLYVRSAMPVRVSCQIDGDYDLLREEDPRFPVARSVLTDEQWTEYRQDRTLENHDLLHWRTYLSYMLRPPRNSYLRLVLDVSSSYKEYRKNVTDHLLAVPCQNANFWELYANRKDLLQGRAEPPGIHYMNAVRAMGPEGIFYLTDNTVVERREILRKIAANGDIPKEIGKIYPALARYLEEYTFQGSRGNLNELMTGYFREYKREKLINQLSEGFERQVEELAKIRPYNALKPRGALLEELDDGGTPLFWIDAMGVEYLGYIQSLATDLGLDVRIQVGRADIPTLTRENRAFYDEWRAPDRRKSVKSLDKIKHGNWLDTLPTRSDAAYVADELGVIEEVMLQIKARLADHATSKVVISSDHGTSRLAVLADHENKLKMSEPGQHSGRCCKRDEVSEKPPFATEGGEFWSLANYDRFQGGKQALGEVHGGATLEEVLVPVIEVTLKSNEPVVALLTSTAFYNALRKEDPEIQLSVLGKPDQVTVTYGGRAYEAVMQSPGIYQVTLAGIREAADNACAQVYVDGHLADEIKFQIKSRAIATNAGNDDFF